MEILKKEIDHINSENKMLNLSISEHKQVINECLQTIENFKN